MRRAVEVESEMIQIGTIEDLAAVFEGMASTHIAKLKDQVTSSNKFFNELWGIYSQLRANSNERQGAALAASQAKFDKDLFVVITSEGGLSGDIDQRMLQWMLKQYDPNTTDLVVMGAHGATLLAQMGVKFRQYIKLPEKDEAIELGGVMSIISEYRRASAFYQTYKSLAIQEVERIDLISQVQTMVGEAGREVISSRDYVFEPSIEEVIAYMESIMMGIALGQVILDSKLAQYASRFNAMSSAKSKAKDLEHDLKLTFNRSRRAESDERSKEVINGIMGA